MFFVPKYLQKTIIINTSAFLLFMTSFHIRMPLAACEKNNKEIFKSQTIINCSLAFFFENEYQL